MFIAKKNPIASKGIKKVAYFQEKSTNANKKNQVPLFIIRGLMKKSRPIQTQFSE